MYRYLERGYKRATSSSNERAVLSCANDVKQGAWRVKLWSEAINFFFFLVLIKPGKWSFTCWICEVKWRWSFTEKKSVKWSEGAGSLNLHRVKWSEAELSKKSVKWSEVKVKVKKNQWSEASLHSVKIPALPRRAALWNGNNLLKESWNFLK